MEPLIRLRLLSSELTDNESSQFIQTLIQSFGAQQIISFIFNHFQHQYQINKTHNDDLQNIINMISNIIQSREKEESLIQDLSKQKTETIKIESLPSEMIRECSSYLPLTDYMNFAKSNRTIYCASNSPLILKELDISGLTNHHNLDLNRFRMIESLTIYPEDFNNFISSSYPIKQNHFNHLNKLCINNKNDNYPEDIESFLNSNVINFLQITYLKCSKFGHFDEEYEFDAFCNLLTRFPNITHLELHSIHLTEFNDENKDISPILPNLECLKCWNLGSNPSANILRNKLINTYCHQLLSLYYNEKTMDIDTYSFGKLKEIGVRFPTNNSLKYIMNTTDDLDKLYLYDISNTELIKSTIIKSLNKFPNITRISFNCNGNELQHIISFIEIGLIKSKEIKRKSLTMIISMKKRYYSISMEEIELYIKRIINGLDASEIEDVMLRFFIPPNIDENGYRYKIIEGFKKDHLAATGDDVVSHGEFEINISNKNCKINGYRPSSI